MSHEDLGLVDLDDVMVKEWSLTKDEVNFFPTYIGFDEYSSVSVVAPDDLRIDECTRGVILHFQYCGNPFSILFRVSEADEKVFLITTSWPHGLPRLQVGMSITIRKVKFESF